MTGYYKYIIVVLAVINSFNTIGQSVKQWVIAAGGGTSNKISGHTIDFTIGEPVITTGSALPVVTPLLMACTQGFQQPLIAKDFPTVSLTLRGTAHKSSILLEWLTSQEIDNDLFFVEKSQNGFNYTVIGQVASKAPGGNSSGDINYQFTDLQPLSGNNYYRLRQVGKNNLINYSNPAIIPFVLADWTVQVYPNPVRNIVNLKIYTSQKEQYVLRMVNMLGQTVLVQPVTAEQGYNAFTINMSVLRKGMYVLLVHNQAIKLLKE
jgi:hypothetical protein